MDDNDTNAGILSLGGFVYQIRVLVYYASEIQHDDKIEFETIDDIAISAAKLNEMLENNPDAFRGMLQSEKAYSAIQVKRSNITDSMKKAIIMNWMLIDHQYGEAISNYRLVTESECSDGVFSVNPEALFAEILATQKKKSSTIRKVKEIFKSEKDRFTERYSAIKDKSSTILAANIDDMIFDKFKNILLSSTVSETIYRLRIRQLVSKMTHSLTEAILQKRPFIYTVSDFQSHVDSVLEEVRESHVELDFAVFRREILLTQSPVMYQTREYRQLAACHLSPNRISDHLLFNEYYFQNKLRQMSAKKISLIDNIELTAHENYQCTKDVLVEESRDTPLNRLNGTKDRPNSYAPKDQIRIGACVYLTKESTPAELMISWKDEA